MAPMKKSELDYEHPAEDVGEFGNPMMRYTILYAAVIVLITFLPIWLSFIIPRQIAYVNAAFILLFSGIWISIGFNALWNFSLMGKVPTPSLEGLKAARERKFKHVVIVPCYIDPVEVLFDCIGSLLTQQRLEDLLVVVAFEAKTPDVQNKIETVRKAFGDRFGHFLITVHTIDRNKEIAGGCSNKNYALRQAHKYLVEHNLVKDYAVTLTTCDTDSLYHPNYFNVLEAAYNAENPSLTEVPRMCVWQPPLFYNWDLDQRPFFNRITGLMRSMMMLGGLISFNLNPMSIFSYPLELGLRAGFINPRYGVDDIIAKVRWMCDTNERVPVLLLPVPVISGPTIGVTFLNEVDEWSRQIRRWIVGSSESFHYFVIHFKGQPLFAGAQWFFMFFMYYAVLLCCAGLFSVLAGIPFPWVHYPTIQITSTVSFNLRNIGLVALVLQYFVFGIAFVIDRMAIRLMTVKEEISIPRNIAHWLLAPPTLLVYSLIAFKAIVKFVFVGKKMARHDMAAKEGLKSGTADQAAATTNNVLNQGLVGAVDEEQNYLEEPNRMSEAKRSRSATMSTGSQSSAVLAMNAHIRASVNSQEQSKDFVNAAGQDKSKAISAVPAGPATILCEMPDQFSFGQYSIRTDSVSYRARHSPV